MDSELSHGEQFCRLLGVFGRDAEDACAAVLGVDGEHVVGDVCAVALILIDDGDASEFGEPFDEFRGEAAWNGGVADRVVIEGLDDEGRRVAFGHGRKNCPFTWTEDGTDLVFASKRLSVIEIFARRRVGFNISELVRDGLFEIVHLDASELLNL